jgi:hypothetical protein
MHTRPTLSLPALAVALWVVATIAVAALPAEPTFLPGASFDPAIPSPEAFLGVRVGSRPLHHEEILRYATELSARSPRARMVPYGRTFEGRELFVLAIGDEKIVADLDGFKEQHRHLLDPRGRSAADDQRAVSGQPAVVWAGYSIHGNELSSADAAVELAYWLVAGTDEKAAAIRSGVLVLLDPCQNPDGRERDLAGVATFAHATPNPDDNDLSHSGTWPSGRGNHYLFDLNRDWFAMSQPESARAGLVASWVPQLVIDSHEMGPDDTYLFSPPRAPFNPFRLASETRWRDRFAADQARALDSRGYSYYTREWNEEFFPGYGSALASYTGAVGILYEMARTSGTLVKQPTGVVRTFAQAVDHQLTSSAANLTTLAAGHTQLLLDQIAARRDVVARGTSGPVRAWLFPKGEHPDRVAALAGILAREGIASLELVASLDATDLHDARTGKVGSRRLEAGTLMVPLDQPAASLARALLDPHVPMDAAFLREEREYLERDKGSRIYDLTAWALPLDYGVEAVWTATRPGGEWRRASAPQEPASAAALSEKAYGYLVDGSSDSSSGLLAALLADGITVRVAEKPFAIGGRTWGRGTMLVIREGNPEDLAVRLAALAARFSVAVVATPTAKSEDGPDLGGSHFLPLQTPRIAVLTGSPTSPEGYGWVWFLLDRELGQRCTALDLRGLARADLERYNVLVVPPVWAEPAALRAALGDRGIERLKRWVEAGGTLIGIGNGATMLADKATAVTATRMRRQALDRFPPAILGLGAEAAESAGPLTATGLRVHPPEKPGKDGPAPAPPPPLTGAPYDVAPVIGPGALPFVSEPSQRTAALPKPVDMASWLKSVATSSGEKTDPVAVERADERLRRFAPKGAFLRAELDPEHWLCFGVGSLLDVMYDDTDEAMVAEPPVQVAARFADPDTLHLGGLVWPEGAGRLARTAWATREPVGRGQVILFLTHPYYRAWTLGTRRMLVNALLYGPGLGTRWSAPW